MLKKPQQAQPQVTAHGHSREPSISSSPALTPDSEAGRLTRPSVQSVVSPLFVLYTMFHLDDLSGLACN